MSAAKLSGKQERAIVALCGAPSIVAAAREVGIGESTLRRWLTDSAFLAALRRARNDAFAESLARLQLLTGKALRALERVLDSTTGTQDAARVTAARAVFDLALRTRTDGEVEERIAALEDRLRNVRRIA